MNARQENAAPAAQSQIASLPPLAFVDVARSLAVILMIQGHTVDALLAPEYRTSRWYYTWLFVRGLTGCMFLVGSGFLFSTIAVRATAVEEQTGRARRFRRFGFFLLLGYALHLPAANLMRAPAVAPENWSAFVAVDVLQCVGVSLAVLQVLRMASSGNRSYVAACSALCAAIVVGTPGVAGIDWREILPLPIAAYLTTTTGSAFPLFPWAAYVFFGAMLGGLFATSGQLCSRLFAQRVLLGGGLLLGSAALSMGLHVPLFSTGDFWVTSPVQFLLRAGLTCVLFSVIAHATQLLRLQHSIVRALARESLMVYFVHLCLVYGSVWAPGLRQLQGTTLSPVSAFSWVPPVWIAMAMLAWGWYSLKQRQPHMARVVRFGAVGLLVGRLL